MSEIKHVSVYDYIEENYKEEWTSQTTVFGGNRWEQYEGSYNYYYAQSTTAYPLTNIIDSMVNDQAELRDLYYEIHETPIEERVDLRSDQDELDRIYNEAVSYQKSLVTDGAAIMAFNEIAPYTGLDYDKVLDEQSNAYNTSIQTKNDSEIAKLEAAAKEKAANDAIPEYLVRGAPLRCLYGTHMRYLDMKETHGVYLEDKPLIHSKDNKVDENIFSFGICNCPTCTLTETTSLMKGAEVDQKGNYLREPDDQILTGIACKPKIIKLWRNTNKEVQIAHTASPGASDTAGATLFSAPTNISYLLCEEGGYIFPLSSGQLEYTSYYAEFFDYPFEDIYSQAFLNWCDLKNICPHFPGTAEYTDWYQEKIENAKNNKEKKQLYEDYLRNAYQYGLDNMSSEDGDRKEAERVEEMKKEFLNSQLLSNKEKSKIEEMYSGLRFDYGYNDQKNIADATPYETEFYDFYINQMNDYNEQISNINKSIMDVAYAEDSGKMTSYSNQLSALREERDNDYARFEQEVQLYDGRLSAAQKEQAQAVSDAHTKKL